MLSRASARILMLFCAVWVGHAQGPVIVVLSGTGYNFETAEEPTTKKDVAAVAQQVIGENLPFWFGPKPSKTVFRVTLEINVPHPELSNISLQIWDNDKMRHDGDGNGEWRTRMFKEETIQNGRVPLSAVPRGKGAWNDPIKYSLQELLAGSNQKSIESALKPIAIGTEVSGVQDKIPAQSKTFFYPLLKFHWVQDISPRGHSFVMHLEAADGDHSLGVVAATLECAPPATSATPNCPVKVVKVRPDSYFDGISFDLNEYKDLLQNKMPWTGIHWKEFYWCRSNPGLQVE